MNLQAQIALRFGGQGSGCNPEVAVPRCGRPSKADAEKRGARTFELPNGRVISVPYKRKDQEKALAKIRNEELAKLSPEVKQAYEAGKDSTALYSKDGVWRPEREALHQSIMREYLSGIKAQEQPTMMVVAGGTASGKSAASKDALEVVKDALYVNADDIRSMLPEISAFLGNGQQGFLHEEAGYIRDRILAAGMEGRSNIVLDAVGSGSVVKLMSEAEKQGYRTSVYYVHRDLESALSGAAKRKYFTDQLSDLRDVPEEATVAMHVKARSSLADLAKGRELKVYDREPNFDDKKNIVYWRDHKGVVKTYNEDSIRRIAHGQRHKSIPEIADAVFPRL